MFASETEFKEFVEFVTDRFRVLSSRNPDPKWADDIKRLAQSTSEVLMSASPMLQETHLFADLKLTHARLLKLMAHNSQLIDSEIGAGNRFDGW